jgi:hypothetical protein
MASITAGNLRVPGTLTVTNVTVNNLVQSSGSIIVTGNSNTIGSIITTGGNVGIGTTAPSSKLDIAGNINISGDFYRVGKKTNTIVTLYTSAAQSVFSDFTVTYNRIDLNTSDSLFTSTTDFTQLTSIMGITYSSGTFVNSNSYPIQVMISYSYNQSAGGYTLFATKGTQSTTLGYRATNAGTVSGATVFYTLGSGVGFSVRGFSNTSTTTDVGVTNLQIVLL